VTCFFISRQENTRSSGATPDETSFDDLGKDQNTPGMFDVIVELDGKKRDILMREKPAGGCLQVLNERGFAWS